MPSRGITSSNPQVSALIPRPASNGIERMRQSHGSNYTPIFLFFSRNHCVINLFIITYAIKEFFSVNHVICCHCNILFFASVERSSIMT